MKLSANFSLSEFTYSATAIERKISNAPPADVIERLRYTAEGLEKIRDLLGGKPIRITSAYRCDELNRAVGGAKNSQHVKGEAADFTCPAFGTPKQILTAIAPKVRELGIDQIICEGTWVHVSFKPNPRGLVMSFVGGKFVKGVA